MIKVSVQFGPGDSAHLILHAGSDRDEAILSQALRGMWCQRIHEDKEQLSWRLVLEPGVDAAPHPNPVESVNPQPYPKSKYDPKR